MKKIFTLIVAACISLAVSAQYYYMGFPNAGSNPGGINTDPEYPVGGGLPATWTSISTPGLAAASWSTTQTIPFAFNFNGSPVTQFKVSTSGVLTFTVGAATAPSYVNSAIPSATIPDNSVMAWGITASGANDYIVTKTFGTTPNRQVWVMFSSFTVGGNYTYWSIALEETSNNIYVIDQRHSATIGGMVVGIQVNATTAYAVNGGANNVNSIAGADALPADNTYYKFIYGTQPANEAYLSSLTMPFYAFVPSSVPVTGTITNYGSVTITAITIKWKIGTNVYSYPANLNIPSNQTGNFTHGTQLSVPTSGAYPIKVWVELPGDANQLNDTLSMLISGATFTPTHSVLCEEATGTWCGWCPRGAVFIDSIAAAYPLTANTVAVHNGDPMVVTAYDAAMGGLIGGYPSGLVDRKAIDVDPSTFFNEYANHINDFGVANLSVATTFNTTTRLATIDVSGTFAVDLSGDYRYSVVLTEDDVVGTTSGFNQVNYYSYMSNNLALVGAGHNWQAEPNPIAAANMQYDHVARALLGGFAGQAGSIPSTVIANGTHSFQFSYTVPAAYNISKMHAIGLLIQASTGAILNSTQGNFPVAVQEIPASDFSVNVFPNPMNGAGFVRLTLVKDATVNFEIVDMTGKVVLSKINELSAGNFTYNLGAENLSNGLYNVKVTVGNETTATRFVVAK